MTSLMRSENQGGSEPPDLWILTVCLNDKHGLAQTLWSIAGQVGIRVGVVIADGGSRDGSLEVAQAFAKYWPLAKLLPGPDRGIYDGMNRALEQVPETALVWFLNAGDFFTDPYAASRTISIASDPSCWLGGPIISVRPSGRMDSITATPRLTDDGRDVLPSQPSVIARKSAIAQAGGLREDLRLASDGLLIEGLASRFPFVPYDTPAVFFGLGGRSAQHIAQTLTEFRQYSNLRGRRQAVWLEDQIVVVKTRARNRLFELERESSALRHLMKKWKTRKTQEASKAPHWPHQRLDDASVDCCRCAAHGFLEFMMSQRALRHGEGD
jgi:hypothetical protein